MSKLTYIRVIYSLLVVICGAAYEVPKAEFKIFYPKGFDVSIPAEENVTLFAFHGKLNEEMEGLEAGKWAKDIIWPNDGKFTFRERVTSLKVGDIIYYWTYAIYNGLGYREHDGVYTVTQYTPQERRSTATADAGPVSTAKRPLTIAPSGTSFIERQPTTNNGISHIASDRGYKVPHAEFKIFYPKGFQVSIPAEENVTLFAFHGKLNEEMEGLEAGKWARDVVRPNDDKFTFHERMTSLKKGDIIYYWTYVIYNGLGYREDDGVYIVTQYTPQDGGSIATVVSPTVGGPASIGKRPLITAPSGITPVGPQPIATATNNGLSHIASDLGYEVPHAAGTASTTKQPLGTVLSGSISKECRPSITTTNNGLAVRCAGDIIFEEQFNSNELDANKWLMERRFSSQPDYEFVAYLLNDEVLKVRNGLATITPIPLTRIYGDDILKNELSLGSNCTGILSTDDCIRVANGDDILPPFISSQFSTKDRFSFKYGKVEIRAKLPNAAWVFPQFFLEPVNSRYGLNNYESGQMRVAFSRSSSGNFVNELFGGVILNAQEPYRSVRMCKMTGPPIDWSVDFHVYTLEWLSNKILVSVDNEKYCSLEPNAGGFANVIASGQSLPNKNNLKTGSLMAPFDQEFYIKLGYGIGGYNDFPDDAFWQKPKPWTNSHRKSMKRFWKKQKKNWYEWLSSSAALQIDYVKVYAV